MIEIWLILAVTVSVVALITALVSGHGITGHGLGKIQSLISALILGPIAATVATALAFVVHWMVVIEAH
jgi:hypothetical protein